MAARSDVIEVDKLWDIFDRERDRAWEGHREAEVGSPEWNIAAGKIDTINNICHAVHRMNAAPRSSADDALRQSGKTVRALYIRFMRMGMGKCLPTDGPRGSAPYASGLSESSLSRHGSGISPIISRSVISAPAAASASTEKPWRAPESMPIRAVSRRQHKGRPLWNLLNLLTNIMTQENLGNKEMKMKKDLETLFIHVQL